VYVAAHSSFHFRQMSGDLFYVLAAIM
jgi:hypothetical protein